MSKTAKNDVGAMNRAQQSYFLESQKFGVTMGEIGMGIPTETDNYSYRVVQPMQPVSDWKKPNSANWVMTIGQAKHKNLNSYLGVVWSFSWSGSDPKTQETIRETTSRDILCEYIGKSDSHWDSIAMPKMIDNQMQCPTDSQYVGN
ncbi:type IV pilin-like G/H family protein [[Phormidium] sp. ETS-05]|uniref:type IV pilin-like G/H family protein n=1 Tax=[Phormidium] sp. ETS-05 TaxID=222819 RepID=UPI0018EF2FBC|nr:type IV pilin-like G/H family protein [[Phormidium] sp. ETS-05]